MTTYNVLAAVVDLIDAPTKADAISILEDRLKRAGFEVYDGQPTDAFESEDQTQGKD